MTGRSQRSLARLLACVLAVVPVVLFGGTPYASAQRAASVSCDRSAGKVAQNAAADAAEHGRWRDERDRALEAYAIYRACVEAPTGDHVAFYRDVFEEGNTLLLMGSAQLQTDGKPVAYATLAQARAIFTSLIGNESVPDALRADARTRIALIGRVVPALRDAPPDAVPPDLGQPATVAVQPVQPPFDILAHWISPGTPALSVLHVRLNVHPARTMPLRPSDFRIVVVSASHGRETARGHDGSSFTYQRADFTSTTNTPVVKPMVDPSEDMGYGGPYIVQGGDSLTKVISFVVRSDAVIDETVLASLAWTTFAAGDGSSFVGVGLTQLTSALRAQLGYRMSIGGVVVTSIIRGSPADRAGIRIGDVIQMMDGRETTSIDSFSTLVRAYRPGTRVAVRVWSHSRGSTGIVFIEFTDRGGQP